MGIGWDMCEFDNGDFLLVYYTEKTQSCTELLSLWNSVISPWNSV